MPFKTNHNLNAVHTYKARTISYIDAYCTIYPLHKKDPKKKKIVIAHKKSSSPTHHPSYYVPNSTISSQRTVYFWPLFFIIHKYYPVITGPRVKYVAMSNVVKQEVIELLYWLLPKIVIDVFVGLVYYCYWSNSYCLDQFVYSLSIGIA